MIITSFFHTIKQVLKPNRVDINNVGNLKYFLLILTKFDMFISFFSICCSRSSSFYPCLLLTRKIVHIYLKILKNIICSNDEIQVGFSNQWACNYLYVILHPAHTSAPNAVATKTPISSGVLRPFAMTF